MTQGRTQMTQGGASRNRTSFAMFFAIVKSAPGARLLIRSFYLLYIYNYIHFASPGNTLPRFDSTLYQEALFLDLIVSMEVGLYHGLSCDEKLWVGVRCSCIMFHYYLL